MIEALNSARLKASETHMGFSKFFASIRIIKRFERESIWFTMNFLMLCVQDEADLLCSDALASILCSN